MKRDLALGNSVSTPRRRQLCTVVNPQSFTYRSGKVVQTNRATSVLARCSLGVAGGELRIPTLILPFGAEIKLVGSLSVAISLTTMAVGLIRHSRDNTFPQKEWALRARHGRRFHCRRSHRWPTSWRRSNPVLLPAAFRHPGYRGHQRPATQVGEGKVPTRSGHC